MSCFASLRGACVLGWLLLAGCSSDDAASQELGGLDAASGGEGGAVATDASHDSLSDPGHADTPIDSALDSASDAAADDAPAPPAGPTRYPAHARHSPMSEQVVQRLTAVLDASSGKKNVFEKLGDSITVNSQFMGCFAGSDVQWDSHADLEPSRAYFDEAIVDGTHSSFNRPTVAAVVGWSAKALLTGNPTPLDQETQAIDPAFAVIMFGTNDTYETGVHPFEHAMLADIDAVLAHGVVPLMSTIPPRGDSSTANALVPEMNAVIRAIAQARQVPLMDFWSLLIGLPGYGLASDGVHPQLYVSGGVHGCWFTNEALGAGMNDRNLITMEALDRARRFLLEHEAPEAAPPALAGSGSLEEPWIIPELPFSDDGDTAAGGAKLSGYGCSTSDESGPELVYQVQIDAPKKLRARVFCDDGVDVDLYWMNGKTPASCVVRADRTLDIDAAAGTYYLVADSYVDQGKVLAGKYRLTLVEL